MGFDQHLFISYAHIDNDRLGQDEGWISRFHASLEGLLRMRMGGEVKIWRDDKLQGTDIFASEIVDQFPQTAVLVSVLSPRYVNSEWCTREAHEFCNVAEQHGGLVIGNKSRVIKIIKTPVDTEEPLPPVMKEVLGYEFFTFEDESPLELDPAYGEKYAQDYNRKVGKLAWDVAQLLKALDASPDDSDGEGAVPDTSKPVIYLAECSYDQREAREILEGELRRHGYMVLPDQTLARDEADYVTAVERMLEACQLSIHIVGNSYGAVPDGPSSKSVVLHQNELAVKRCKEASLSRIIWLPEDTQPDSPQQEAFIAQLHNDDETQFGADLITSDLETLKGVVHSTLKGLETQEPVGVEESEETEGEQKLVYLICDEKDRKATVPVRKFLRDQGLDVTLPAFEGDATAVREANQQQLASCDAVIVFYGLGEEAWKRSVDNELKKMPGYREGKELLASYTYLAEPKTPDKEDLIDMEEPNLLDGLRGFAPTEMEAFMQELDAPGADS